MDFNRLRVVSERADDSERSLMVTIPETPGAFRAMYAKIWPRNVTEFTYRYNTEREAAVLVSFQPLAHVENDFARVMDDFKADDFQCADLTHNELAKTHIRHLAGGRSNAPHERLFRFHFPEVCILASSLDIEMKPFPPFFRPHSIPHLPPHIRCLLSHPVLCNVSWTRST
jgi:threonine dehydratase